MDQSEKKLRSILGDKLYEDIAADEKTTDIQSYPADQNSQVCIVNSKDILCKCTTLILRPNHAKLILPTELMLEVDKELGFYQQGDELFSRIIRGCYWLVDDMYKFEQMGYTKEINSQNLIRQPQTSERIPSKSSGSENNSQLNESLASALTGLRYLACAECNLCPLGWFDPATKESYLYVWSTDV